MVQLKMVKKLFALLLCLTLLGETCVPSFAEECSAEESYAEKMPANETIPDEGPANESPVAEKVSAQGSNTSVEVSEENFPDEIFRQYVSETFDADKDGTLSEEEIKAVNSINLYEKGVSSLKGVGFFTDLADLNCGYNDLESLDVSDNLSLERLYCHDNRLASLDVSKNINLKELLCYDNELTGLDVSKNTALIRLDCLDNNLTALDVSNNAALTKLICASRSNDKNKIVKLDLSNNPALTYLWCSGNRLASLDVSKNIALEYLNCGDNKLENLDVNKNSELSYLICEANRLTSLDVSKNTVLERFYCGGNSLTKLDVSQNTFLDILHCETNKLTALDVSNNAYLNWLNCDDNELTYLNVDANVALGELDCSGNKLTELYITNSALESLVCIGNEITELDVSGCTALSGLACGNNKLTEIDVSSNTALTSLGCGYNDLETVDVSKNAALEYLGCTGNRIAGLDVGSNASLSELICAHNCLTSLDVSNNTALQTLDCSENNLTSLDIGMNTSLTRLRCTGNKYKISGDGVDLSSLPGFDAGKVKGCTGGSFDTEAGRFSFDQGAHEATYTYDVGQDKTAVFKLFTAYVPPGPEVTGDQFSNNRNCQDYTLWSSPVMSYLTENASDGVMRVEAMENYVLVEYYDKEFNLIRHKAIEKELPWFGGFYEGTDYYFLVFGQANYQEDDSAEVIRVIRYTKDWRRMGAASLYGANTSIPFDAGSLRMAEHGEYLYIMTSHQMYKSSDGLNHQSNMLFSVYIPMMHVADPDFIAGGYVSHSFNQFIAFDGNDLLMVNHGDAYPRSVVLMGGGYLETELLKIKGWIGDNSTGVGVGGFEVTDSSYLVAGNSIDQEDANVDFGGQRNIFLSVTPRGRIGSEESELCWLTHYPDGAEIKVSVPHLVRIDGDYFILLWMEDDTLCYQFISGSGGPIGQISRKTEMYLSDCKPVVLSKSGKLRRRICWYTTMGSQPIFYSVPLPDVRAQEITFDQSEINLYVGDLVTLKVAVLPNNAADKTLAWESSDPATAAVRDGKVTAIGLGTAKITAKTNDGGQAAECVVTVGGIRIIKDVFPDKIFRRFIRENFDMNKDEVISGEELTAVTDINVSYMGISSVKGIEHFAGLSSLDCTGNKLTSLDVGKNTALEHLDCGHNSISNLDVSKNTVLATLRCDGNKLINLDVSKNAALEILSCAENNLRSLDISGNTALKKLDCSYNELTSLDISANTELDFEGRGFKADGNLREVIDGIEFEKLHGFDPGKVESCKGGTFGENGKFIFDADAEEATYIYDVGRGTTAAFTLRKIVYILGDINGDEKINIIDARWALQTASGNRKLTEKEAAAADVNGDGKVNIIDARWLLQAASGNRTL